MYSLSNLKYGSTKGTEIGNDFESTKQLYRDRILEKEIYEMRDLDISDQSNTPDKISV